MIIQNESFSAHLMEQAKPIWDKYLQHPFIIQLGDGTLDKKKFANYLIQDTLYLKYFSKVYAYAFIKAEDIEVMRRIYQDMNVIMADEAMMHIRYLKEMGITEQQALATPMEPECKQYTDYMLKIAAEGTTQEGLVSLMPCTLSYHHIAQYARERALKNDTLEDNYFKHWILDYVGEVYAGIYQSTVELGDIVCNELSPVEKQRLVEIFIKSSEYELAFWDMAIR